MKKILLTSIAGLIVLMFIIGTNNVNAEENSIPDWIKVVFQFYTDDVTTDSELINALEFLISNGIIEIEEKQYVNFSKEKFPDTGGFNPAWLEGEREKILETCQEASEMGFENSYCQYVQ